MSVIVASWYLCTQNDQQHCVVQLRPIGDVLRELRVKDFAIEICILAGIVLYLVNMVIGARANRQIANRWCMLFGIGKGILPQQFAHVGIGELSTPSALSDQARLHSLP